MNYKDNKNPKPVKEKKLDYCSTKDKGIKEEEIAETTYYYKNGLRYVKPYYYTFKVVAKGRWINKEVKDLFVKEFKVFK